MKYLTQLFIVLNLFACTVYAGNTVMDNSTKQIFPKEISFDSNGTNYQLQATGVATRKKFMINVYSIAHYLQKNADKSDKNKFQIALSDSYAKQFTMKWVRDVGADKIEEGFRDSFHKVFPGDKYQQMKGEIDQFIGFLNNGAHKGDEFILRSTPGGHIEVLINGKTAGSLTNEGFASGLWSIWFGDDSIVNRNDLVSLMN